MENSEERKGSFSASRISELLTGGSGKTRDNYIYDIAKEVVIGREDFDTEAMKHGRSNQINAFDKVVKPNFHDAKWVDTYIPINSNCGASPDIIVGVHPLDVKCPFYIDTYLEQINSIPKKYYQQVQMQAMALQSDLCYLTFYLTKPERWGDDKWEEYPIPLEDRFKTFEFKIDEEVCDNILKAVEESWPKRDIVIEKMMNATVIDESEFFYYQFLKQKKFRKAKEGNIVNIEYLRLGNEFYYEVRQ
jgi:hypothetical protein